MIITISVNIPADATAGRTLYEILQGIQPATCERIAHLNVDEEFYLSDEGEDVVAFRPE